MAKVARNASSAAEASTPDSQADHSAANSVSTLASFCASWMLSRLISRIASLSISSTGATSISIVGLSPRSAIARARWADQPRGALASARELDVGRWEADPRVRSFPRAGSANGKGNMAIRYAPEERAALEARARAMLAACPDVGSFIRCGLGRNSSGEAIVYLRTALDPAPVVTSADAFGGLLGSASRWLRRNGVGPRDVVSLLAPNCTATSVVYWAAMSSAAVQPLNLLFTREAIAAQVDAVGAKILFTPPPGAPGGLFEKVEGLRALAPRLERIVVLPLDGTVAFDGEEIAPDDGANQRWESVAEPDRVVALLPTGGTTGAPKVVPLTNRNVVASAIASMLAGEFCAVDRIMVALPLFHVGGSFCASLAGLGAGATLVIPTAGGFRNPEVVANFWRIVEAQRLTVGGLVPTGLGAAAAVPTAGADISRLRLFQTGASVCPPEMERRFLSVWPGDCVRQIYGMTEFAGAITQTPWDREQRQGSVGGPVALAEVGVLANGQIHRGASPSGEIVARGPQMFSGYFDPQIGASFHEGW